VATKDQQAEARRVGKRVGRYVSRRHGHCDPRWPDAIRGVVSWETYQRGYFPDAPLSHSVRAAIGKAPSEAFHPGTWHSFLDGVKAGAREWQTKRCTKG
jgi:hypothetical protein